MLADLFYQEDNSSDIHHQQDYDPKVSNKVNKLNSRMLRGEFNYFAS
jgi:hypothetical protein